MILGGSGLAAGASTREARRENSSAGAVKEIGVSAGKFSSNALGSERLRRLARCCCTRAATSCRHACSTGQLLVSAPPDGKGPRPDARSEEHTSELQSRENIVCRL